VSTGCYTPLVSCGIEAIGCDGPPNSRFEPFGADKNGDPWLGFQAWRATFDALLLERACRLGAIVRQPCQATGLLLDGRRVIGVQTSGGNLKARFVIDAAGGGHWLARKLALPLRRYSPRLIARFGYVRGECPARDEAPALLADAEGWTWTARVRPQLYQWTRLSWDVASTQGDYLPDEFYGLEPQGKTRAADVTWRIVTDCAGDGYFLAGDAAAQLDPAASHGVLKGLMSGMMVAHLINKVMRGEATEQQATQSYREWLAGWFKADVERLRELYALLPECEWVVATQL
jgi:flavin-dependent dehydrogenase